MGAIAYYNEIDPYTAQWLRNLIRGGHIAPGDVDERSIEDVHPDDLKPYTQCHFFAGIGVWSYALRRAGWPDDRPVWTGSCPCQPFSSAGQGDGFDDKRHLWPHFHWLIQERKPPELLGEQVASKDAESWLDLVQADLEAMDYAFGAIAFPSAGVGAPHIRDRTYWVANATGQRQHRRRPSGAGLDKRFGLAGVSGRAIGADQGQTAERTSLHPGRLAKPDRLRLEQASGRELHYAEHHLESRCSDQRMADADRYGQRASGRPGMHCQGETRSLAEQRGPVNGMWADADWLHCRDGKWRPVEPGTFPLAHGAPGRVGRLRAYGNAINAEAATQFIAAYLDTQR
ncbi:DNA cytosine methyltransferase [Pseudomonas sp. P66]|uniref:DNA cytosine methyltransferase n=1 Tax=Pseudomonas arcuscaelestis TaxID=2710591 RepID=A0ABS2C2Z3_9PSED|nr:DNA cytosine methyltransferase [Pseudomonas arcuscaelestis]MBM5460252.1 DNA cytosine methyltransferase [Pseudomonas arcuscaelestis]